jgi:hypothetical protein
MRMTGSPLAQVEPAPFKITERKVDPVSGLQTEIEHEFKGGYYPIHWDSRPGRSSGRVGDYAVAGKMPRVPSEFLIEREDNARIQPDLNWTGMPTHLLRVAHNLAFGEFVQDTARVLLDRDVQKEIAAYRGDDFAKGLGRWLERVALDVSGGPDSTYNAADKNAGLRILRRTLVRSTVAFNYPILFAHATHPIATGEARYGSQYALDYSAPAMADVLKGYTDRLVTGQNQVRDDALSMFTELQHRSDTLREEMGRWLLDREFKQLPTNAVQKAVYAIDEHVFEGAGMAHFRFMDEAFSTITALAKYRESIDKGLGQEEAARLANKEVAETMPTYSQMEQPEIMADKHSLRAAGVMWHTYYGTWRGIWRDARYEGARRPGEEYEAETGRPMPYARRAMNEAEVFGHMIAGLGLAFVLGAYFKGQGPEKHEKTGQWMLKRSLLAPTEVLPYAASITERGLEVAPQVFHQLRPYLGYGRRPQPFTFENTYLSPIAHGIEAASSWGDQRKSPEDRALKLARATSELTGFPKPVLSLGQFGLHGADWYDHSPRGAAATATDFAAHVFYPYHWGRTAQFQPHNPIMDAAHLMEAK